MYHLIVYDRLQYKMGHIIDLYKIAFSEIDENLHKRPLIEHGAFSYLPACAIRPASVRTTTIFNTLFTDYGRLLEDTRIRKTQKDKKKQKKTYSLSKKHRKYTEGNVAFNTYSQSVQASNPLFALDGTKAI